MENNLDLPMDELRAELLGISLSEYQKLEEEIKSEAGSDLFTQVHASRGKYAFKYTRERAEVAKKMFRFLKHAFGEDENMLENFPDELLPEFMIYGFMHSDVLKMLPDNSFYYSLSDGYYFPEWVTYARFRFYCYVLLSSLIDPMFLLLILEGDKVKISEKELVRMELLKTIFADLEAIRGRYDTIDDASMEKLRQQVNQTAAMRLHQRLVSAGAYERLNQLDPRRATMLQTYLTTEKSIPEVGKEAGLRSRTSAHQLIHSSMEIAFFTLPEEERADYGNDPAQALRIRSAQQTNTKGERIKKAYGQLPRNPETGKIQFSDTHKENIGKSASRRWQRHREMQQEQVNGNTPN